MEDIKSAIIEKAKEFLETRKNSDYLTEILDDLDNYQSTYEAILALEMIFSESLKNRSMLTTGDSTNNAPSEHVSWLRDQYETTWNKLLNLMYDKTNGEQAALTLFKLLEHEGKFPLVPPQKGVYYFPLDKLEIILKQYFNTKITQGALNQLDEFTNYIDVVYYLWLLVPSILTKIKKLDEPLKAKILDILKEVPIPSEEELQDYDPEVLLCVTKNKTKFKPKYAAIQESIHNLWNIIIKWNATSNTHKKVLVLLIENLMVHLSKPILTMDYLMESLNAGGAVSLLALQGVFTLVKDHNLEYPNIYGKLYSFFHPSIFYTKYKSRLYVLTNIFLSSTHLPEALVASYMKRFARLCLCAPPQDIIILCAFIGNLLIRHSGLRKMIQHPEGGSVSSDPYLEDELDPMKTKAMESSLWELKTLEQHILPQVSNAVNFINKPLPSVEWDLTPLIEKTYKDVFEKECKKKIQKVSVTFERPDSFVVPKTDYFSNLWNFN
ncbi:nucleolar complex protein 4 homolog A [Planococcus citri]|uniref:nucleolar complex protein 4 homolog A n=1 Tax=Planococcus citri TaxID=170843 RepID=UPI0031F9BB82